MQSLSRGEQPGGRPRWSTHPSEEYVAGWWTTKAHPIPPCGEEVASSTVSTAILRNHTAATLAASCSTSTASDPEVAPDGGEDCFVDAMGANQAGISQQHSTFWTGMQTCMWALERKQESTRARTSHLEADHETDETGMAHIRKRQGKGSPEPKALATGTTV